MRSGYSRTWKGTKRNGSELTEIQKESSTGLQSDKEIKIRVRDVEGRDRMEPYITVGIQYTEERMRERFSKLKRAPKIFSYKIHKNHTES